MRRDRGPIGTQPTQLNEVVVTGTVAGAAPAPSVQSFERARMSAVQREAKTLADTDMDVFSEKEVRQAGERLFKLQDGVWSDTQLSVNPAGTRRVTIRPYSAAYFKLLDLLPVLREPFALGDRVRIAGRRVLIEVDETGVATLSDYELQSIRADW